MAGYECLRSNDQIDYRPLNLNIILHESDITYNLALCCLAMENIEDFKSFVNSALETAQVWAIPYGFEDSPSWQKSTSFEIFRISNVMA